MAILLGLLLAAFFIYLDIFGDKEEVLNGCLTGIAGIAGILIATALLGAIHPILGIIVFIGGFRAWGKEIDNR